MGKASFIQKTWDYLFYLKSKVSTQDNCFNNQFHPRSLNATLVLGWILPISPTEFFLQKSWTVLATKEGYTKWKQACLVWIRSRQSNPQRTNLGDGIVSWQTVRGSTNPNKMNMLNALSNNFRCQFGKPRDLFKLRHLNELFNLRILWSRESWMNDTMDDLIANMNDFVGCRTIEDVMGRNSEGLSLLM